MDRVNLRIQLKPQIKGSLVPWEGQVVITWGLVEVGFSLRADSPVIGHPDVLGAESLVQTALVGEAPNEVPR